MKIFIAVIKRLWEDFMCSKAPKIILIGVGSIVYFWLTLLPIVKVLTYIDSNTSYFNVITEGDRNIYSNESLQNINNYTFEDQLVTLKDPLVSIGLGSLGSLLIHLIILLPLFIFLIIVVVLLSCICLTIIGVQSFYVYIKNVIYSAKISLKEKRNDRDIN